MAKKMEWSVRPPAKPSGGSLKITIQGIAQRTASAVNDWVGQMKDAGMNDQKITTRLEEEISSGRIISEMKKFAEVKIPGYSGEIVHRFARDTLTAEEKSKKAKDLLQEMRDNQLPTDKTQEAIDAWEKQGIDTASWGEGGMPDPPPDSELTDLFTWCAIIDKNTCDVCAENHDQTMTLAEWADIGIPRSGACAGEERCRCLLIPADSVQPGDVPEAIKIPKE